MSMTPLSLRGLIDGLESLNDLQAFSSLSSVLADHLPSSDLPLGHEPDSNALAQALKVLK